MEFCTNRTHNAVSSSCRNSSINGQVCTAFFITHLVTDITQTTNIPIHIFTNNQLPHDTINTTKQILDRLLRVEISALREICDKNEVTKNWLSKYYQLSDVLTKQGASYHSFIKVLLEGRIDL